MEQNTTKTCEDSITTETKLETRANRHNFGTRIAQSSCFRHFNSLHKSDVDSVYTQSSLELANKHQRVPLSSSEALFNQTNN